MMKEEVIDALYHAFCEELREIKSELDENKGAFKSEQQVECAHRCIESIKDLKKIEAIEAKAAMPGLR